MIVDGFADSTADMNYRNSNLYAIDVASGAMRRLSTVDGLTGCSAAWLARLLGVQEVVGSNPAIPTNFVVRCALDAQPDVRRR